MKPIHRIARCTSAALAALALTCAACGGGSETTRRIAIPSQEYGGYVSITGFGDLMVAWSGFFTEVSPAQEFELFRFADDRCVIYEGTPTTLYSWLDVGPSITVSGPVDMTLSRKIDGTKLFYEWIDSMAGYPIGTTYTAAITGTGGTPALTLGTLRMPADFELISTDLYVIPDVIRYTPNVGADVIQLYIEGPDAMGTCYAKDDGEFDVPAEFLEQTGIPATVQAYARNVDIATFNGKTVVLYAQTN